MHYHCEIVLPPNTDDIESAVASVMAPFDENQEDSEGVPTWWDWYVIGGRFAGSKLMASYDKDKLEEFHQWLLSEGVTVARLQCGKQEISPASQIPMVDSKWNEMFPTGNGTMVACPIFQHSNDQYGRDQKGTIDGDICPLSEARQASCCRVIFASPSYDRDTEEFTGPLEAAFMLSDSVWNGVNLEDTNWDGTMQGALALYEKRLERYKSEYRSRVEPTDEWLTVTVDYHS